VRYTRRPRRVPAGSAPGVELTVEMAKDLAASLGRPFTRVRLQGDE
jgi:hypothetical protein